MLLLAAKADAPEANDRIAANVTIPNFFISLLIGPHTSLAYVHSLIPEPFPQRASFGKPYPLLRFRRTVWIETAFDCTRPSPRDRSIAVCRGRESGQFVLVVWLDVIASSEGRAAVVLFCQTELGMRLP
ncbi:MAG: hypothetical protein ABI346_06595 [Candidatus Baltobacteraceae bacterium]